MAANTHTYIHTYIHTHNFRKCSHASVGLAQARPNKNFPLLGVQNALRSVQLSIQVQFSRFLQVPPCKIHGATCRTYQNTEKTLFLPYTYLAQG